MHPYRELSDSREKDRFFMMKSLFFNLLSFFYIIFKFCKKRPQFVFGTGVMFVARQFLPPIFWEFLFFILEQNSVMGLTNHILSKLSKIVFTSFDSVIGLKETEKNLAITETLSGKNFLWTKLSRKMILFKYLYLEALSVQKKINILTNKFMENYKKPIQFLFFTKLAKTTPNPKPSLKIPISYIKKTEYIDNIAYEYQKSDFCHMQRWGKQQSQSLRISRKPAIIIPIQFHQDKHQVYNAQSLKKEVTFPVYIESVEDLLENNCKKIQDLVYKEYERKKSTLEVIKKYERTSDTSSLIIKDILNYVQK